MNHSHLLKPIGGGVIALGVTLGMGAIAPAQAQDLDPSATEVLQLMADYLAETDALSRDQPMAISLEKPSPVALPWSDVGWVSAA